MSKKIITNSLDINQPKKYLKMFFLESLRYSMKKFFFNIFILYKTTLDKLVSKHCMNPFPNRQYEQRVDNARQVQ